MFRIKKLDIFILKSFLLLFAGTFFICLFVFIMQFLWRWVDELVGKGLGVTVLAQFFYYSTLILIPASLPLAILLAALMTFGNFGERYELLSMKSAGIPLTRIMRPLIILCILFSAISFYFQNVVAPKAQQQLWTLVVSIKQTNPELDIPEGVFYNEIDGYNIYVKQKDRNTGMLKDVLIYNISEGFENAHVIWAERGKIESTEDQNHLRLHLYNGEQFENLKSQTISSKNVPYRRETFREKHAIIEFKGGFEMVDGSFLSDRSDTKNMAQISHSIDSLRAHVDSVGMTMYKELNRSTYRAINLNASDSVKMEQNKSTRLSVDSLFDSYTMSEKERVLSNAANYSKNLATDWHMKGTVAKETDTNIRRHQTDWHKKITTSLACLIFFFIGAPLGAIIRKGGLGMPVIISVLFFVLYYIIDTGAVRVARSGEMNIILGTWMSTLVLTPLGAFFTYKSNKDSVVFNIDVYRDFFRALFGIRQKRNLFKKEVIIEDPNYPRICEDLLAISDECRSYLDHHSLKTAPNYLRIFGFNEEDNHIAQIHDRLEKQIEELSNSKDHVLLELLNRYPIISSNAHKRPFKNRWLNILTGLVFPVGLVFFFRIWMFSIRLDKDLNRIIQNNGDVTARIKDESFIK
ncbi:MAG: LptF/LptG family permease [Phocaeicola sp.]|nr:LptF/LptG family permease [Phocaeicola sp.]